MRRGPLFRHRWFAWFTGAVVSSPLRHYDIRAATEAVEPVAETADV